MQCIYLRLRTKYSLKEFLHTRNYSVQEIVENKNVEICVNIRIKMRIKINANKPNILIHGKKKCKIILTKVRLQAQADYSLLRLRINVSMTCWQTSLEPNIIAKTRIISFVLTWYKIATAFHNKYFKKLFHPFCRGCILSIVLKRY